METDVDMEIKRHDFHIDLQNACWRFAQFPQARQRLTENLRGGPNQMIKVGQIRWTKPRGFPQQNFLDAIQRKDLPKAHKFLEEFRKKSSTEIAELADLLRDLLAVLAAENVIDARRALRQYGARVTQFAYKGYQLLPRFWWQRVLTITMRDQWKALGNNALQTFWWLEIMQDQRRFK